MSQEISSCDTKSLRLDAQLAERKLLLHSLLARRKSLRSAEAIPGKE